MAGSLERCEGQLSFLCTTLHCSLTYTGNIYKACNASQQKNNLNSYLEGLGEAIIPSGDEAQSHRGVLRDIIENTLNQEGQRLRRWDGNWESLVLQNS